MGVFSIIAMAWGVLDTVLVNKGVIGASTDNLVSSLLATVGPLITGLKAGGTKVQDTLVVLGTLIGVIEALKKTTGLPAAALTQLEGLDADVQAALLAYVQSGKGVDLSVLTPIPLVA